MSDPIKTPTNHSRRFTSVEEVAVAVDLTPEIINSSLSSLSSRSRNDFSLPMHANQSSEISKVPYQIFFTYKTNILETKEPVQYYENILYTIQKYREYWKEPEAPVEFLDDEACRRYIELAYPDLLQHFNREKKGAYKGDICRIAALYLKGGYYFDVDIRVVEPVPLADNVTFSTAISPSGIFFQAWLASAPRHVVLQQALDEMLEHYEGTKIERKIMGCATLTNAYASVNPVDRGEVLMLQEHNLESKQSMYPDLPRQSGRGSVCNYVVHDEATRKVYFYSRIVGSFNCPFSLFEHTGEMIGSALTAPKVPLTLWR
jgi:hypothetical protein